MVGCLCHNFEYHWSARNCFWQVEPATIHLQTKYYTDTKQKNFKIYLVGKNKRVRRRRGSNWNSFVHLFIQIVVVDQEYYIKCNILLQCRPNVTCEKSQTKTTAGCFVTVSINLYIALEFCKWKLWKKWNMFIQIS